MERHEVEAFLTLAEELHFGRTAERLHVSTARVSQTIAKLERRIGVPLFNRTSRRVEVTAVGRQLLDAVRPAWNQIVTAVEQATEIGRGMSGRLRVAFVGAAGGQVLLRAAEVFRRRCPDCEVQIREAQITELLPWLRDGEVDVALGTLPFDEPGIASSPVLVSEARVLAVPAGHPFARRASVSMEDLAAAVVLQLPGTLPGSVREDRTPPVTPSGKPIVLGPAADTFNEILTLVSAGRGVFPAGEQVLRFYPRPGVAYVPISDAPPLRWGLLWRADSASARVRAFTRAAGESVEADGPG